MVLSPPRVGARFVSDLFDDGALYDALRLARFLEQHWSPAHNAPGMACVRRRVPRVVIAEITASVNDLRDLSARLMDLSPSLLSAECEARIALDALDASLTYLLDDDARDEDDDRALAALHEARANDDDPLALCDNLRLAARLAARFSESLRMLDERFSPDALTRAVEVSFVLETALREELPLRPELDAALLSRAVHARRLWRCLLEAEKAAAYVFRRGHEALPAQAVRRYRPRDEPDAEPRTSPQIR